jgi:hypothetical protein
LTTLAHRVGAVKVNHFKRFSWAMAPADNLSPLKGSSERPQYRALASTSGCLSMKIRKSGVIGVTVLTVLAVAALVAAAPSAPRLVLQITVDQLRGDLPGRYTDRLSEGGFRYLMEKGTWYIDAHYQHANTETAVGHAILATGADPSRHGIVANDWIDQKTGAFVYNT